MPPASDAISIDTIRKAMDGLPTWGKMPWEPKPFQLAMVDRLTGEKTPVSYAYSGRSRRSWSGIDVIENEIVTDPWEDWSGVRSPGRARRRLKRGFKQNIVQRRKPAAYMIEGTLWVHPEIGRQWREQIEQRWDNSVLCAMRGEMP